MNIAPSLDTVYLWAQIAVVLFGFLTLVTGKMVADRETKKSNHLAKQTLELQKNLAEAKEKQAKAEAERQLAQVKIERFVREPRTVNPIKSKALLEHRPKGSVAIKYLDGVEPERIANELQKTLADNGWQSSIQKVGSDIIHDAGIAIITGSKPSSQGGLDESGRPKFFDEPGQTLFAFLDSCIDGAVMGWSTTNPQLDENTSVVLIGPKVW